MECKEEPFEYGIEPEDGLDLINPEMLDIPEEEDESQVQNQIFYLTVDNSNEEVNNEVEEVGDTFLTGSDLKLITLEDGRMFITTDNILENLTEDGETQLLITPPVEENEAKTEHNESLINTENLNDLDESVLHLIEVNEGDSQILQNTTENPVKRKKTFPCPKEGCQKTYFSASHLKVHERRHTDNKPYECTVESCGKRFATNYSLKAHIRSHTGEKPYGCVTCGKQFKTSGDLQKHIRSHTGEKPFACPFPDCGKAFTTSNIRKVHIRSHTGERPYSCNYPNCGKAFISSTNYKNHLRIHSGEKPYVCPVENCGKRFTEYSSLYKHNAVHQEFRNYVCTICKQGFKQENGLNFHKIVKHNVVMARDGTEIFFKIGVYK